MPTHGCIKCGYGIPGCCICLNHEHTTRGTNESVTKPFGVSTTDLTLVNLGNLGLAMEDTNLRAVSACEVLGQIFAREIGNVLTHIKQHGIYIDEQKTIDHSRKRQRRVKRPPETTSCSSRAYQISVGPLERRRLRVLQDDCSGQNPGFFIAFPIRFDVDQLSQRVLVSIRLLLPMPTDQELDSRAA